MGKTCLYFKRFACVNQIFKTLFKASVHVIGRPFVKQFALSYRSVVCPVCLSVCLSVTLVYCGQTVGWIKVKLGMQVGLGSGHIALAGDRAPLPQSCTAPISTFGPYLLWSNDWMDQDATWYGGSFRPMQHCVRWGPSSPPQKGGRASQFSAHVYCGQTAG